MGKIFFNEDPNHFVYTRKMLGYQKITMQDVDDFIRQYRDTQITDFFVCVGAESAWYNSSLIDNVIKQYDRWMAAEKTGENETDTIVSCVRLAKDFF